MKLKQLLKVLEHIDLDTELCMADGLPVKAVTHIDGKLYISDVNTIIKAKIEAFRHFYMLVIANDLEERTEVYNSREEVINRMEYINNLHTDDWKLLNRKSNGFK